jgi:hypothetical protein
VHSTDAFLSEQRQERLKYTVMTTSYVFGAEHGPAYTLQSVNGLSRIGGIFIGVKREDVGMLQHKVKQRGA